MINLSNYAHVSFDLDGTLINSVETMRVAWNSACMIFDLKQSFEDYLKGTGKPFHKIMDKLNIEDPDGLIQQHYFDVASAAQNAISLFDGAADVLRGIENTGLSWSIITSKPRRNVTQLLHKFDLKPNVLVCGDDFVQVKPSAYPMRYVREELSLGDNANIVYIGDTISDYIFALNSNVDYVHANFGIHGPLSKRIYPRPNAINSLIELKIYKK